jgi:hypothetical protein
MNRLDRRDFLIVAIRAGVIVGPRDRRGQHVVANVTRGIRILMLRVKEMRAPDSAQRTQRRSEILVIARGENAAAALVKTRDSFAVGVGQSVSGIDGKQPKLVDISLIEHAQDGVVAVCVCLSIACSDFVKRDAVVVFERREMISQQRKPRDVPIVFRRRNSRLQQDVNRISHDLCANNIAAEKS